MNLFQMGDLLLKFIMFLLFLLFTGLMGVLLELKRRKQDHFGYWLREESKLLWILTSGSELEVGGR